VPRYSDAGAQQRRGRIERQIRRKTKHVVFVDNDLVGIPAHRRRLTVTLDAAIGERRALGAELFQAGAAGRAPPAGIDEASDADRVADPISSDGPADSGHDSGNFMPRDHREDRSAPLVASLMNVGMADSAVLDVDQHVVFERIASIEGEWG